MNKTKLKSYAPQARKDFIAAVEARANLLGLAEKGGKLDVTPSEKKGDLALIGGQAWPAKVHEQRERLIKRIKKDGYAQTLEAVAYTWFNRFAALRYMEIHDYLGHGYRVLSSREGGLPEILTHATEVSAVLPGLNAGQIAEMKLAGDKDGELYRLLLVAQCNALSNAMPFLFERIDDESELLLPGNLERTDSVVAKLVRAIDEDDWSKVEIIGWLYQFYILEKKDEVIGKVVKSEDIPAATQLFTPNWIVQYLVQNSVGRLWLMANPTSTLKSQWPYYIEPAEQTSEVQAQINALIQTRMAKDGSSLNPESITVLDPACGSGHILVEAYEVLKAIYLERGYQARAVPRLILERNLYGLDIDDRAAQLAGFALMMKARADDRRLLDSPIKLNILSLQESKGLDLDEFAGHLKSYGVSRDVLDQLFNAFEHAKTFGSLIQIPESLYQKLGELASALEKASQTEDVFVRAAVQDLVPLVDQAVILSMKFDAVVANPPYMGGKAMSTTLKQFAKYRFPTTKSDLFAMFIERGFDWCRTSGINSMVTMQSWMFLTSFSEMRNELFNKRSLLTLIEMPYDGRGPTAMGISFGVVASVFINHHVLDLCSAFDCFRYYELTEDGVPKKFPSENERCVLARPDEFRKIPGLPVAYWLSDKVREAFVKNPSLGSVADIRQGMATTDNAKFLRYWYEVDIGESTIKGGKRRWFPYNKGGDFRKWYGNHQFVVLYENDGNNLIELVTSKYPKISDPEFVIKNRRYYFRECATWSDVTSAKVSARYIPPGFIFDTAGPSIFSLAGGIDSPFVPIGLINSCASQQLIPALNPTMHFNLENAKSLPVPGRLLASAEVVENIKKMIAISKSDWDCREISWDFEEFCLLGEGIRSNDLSSSFQNWKILTESRLTEMVNSETANNGHFIRAFELDDELSDASAENEVTLIRAGRGSDSKRLISYIVGCMMGRYSLDEPGLIYAHAGNIGFDATRYKSFRADPDGIVPITDELWFEDDVTNRVSEFMRVVWGDKALEENTAWLAESLGKKANETPEETLRRYLSDTFFRDHLQTYKKRPIYWLFSSGKQGAFQALVYLHRYHEGTLARMRAEYVVPLTGKMQSRIEMLEKDRDAASSTATRNKIAKQIESLKKKYVELLAYDEKLRHFADMRIQLDLDDGVRVNYGKFGDLLAEVKAVTGGSNDE